MLLIDYLETLDCTEKKVVFIDELSWMVTRKSGVVCALGFFWNSWAVNQNIVVVICGGFEVLKIRSFFGPEFIYPGCVNMPCHSNPCF